MLVSSIKTSMKKESLNPCCTGENVFDPSSDLMSLTFVGGKVSYEPSLMMGIEARS